MPNPLAPPPQHGDDVNAWEWRDWFYRIWERSNQFCSEPTQLVSAGTVTFAHNLGQIPNDISVIFENAIADAGYNPGDRVSVPHWNEFMAVEVTSTEVIGRVLAAGATMEFVHKVTRLSTNIIFSNWLAIIVAKV